MPIDQGLHHQGDQRGGPNAGHRQSQQRCQPQGNDREAGEDVEPEARQSWVIAVGFTRMAAFVLQLQAGDPASGLSCQGWHGIGRILCWNPFLR
jgi:hypothetical protein